MTADLLGYAPAAVDGAPMLEFALHDENGTLMATGRGFLTETVTFHFADRPAGEPGFPSTGDGTWDMWLASEIRQEDQHVIDVAPPQWMAIGDSLKLTLRLAP